jgi:alpha-mannosidase
VQTIGATEVPSIKTLSSPPFFVTGARNVFLETIKRGEDDFIHDKTTIIVRLYEAFGGHAQARLAIGDKLPISKIYLTNLLEDESEHIELNIMTNDPAAPAFVKLDFRGFEVKTVKIVLDKKGSKPKTETCVLHKSYVNDIC